MRAMEQLATPFFQIISVLLCLLYLARADLGLAFPKKSFSFDALRMKTLLAIGLPISCQDGLIQISFLIITAIANSRGVEVAAAVGIVEKIISFLFLAPAMLSTVAAFAAQNAGAGNDERGRQALLCGIRVCIIFRLFTTLIVHFCAEWVISLFVSHEPEVIRMRDANHPRPPMSSTASLPASTSASRDISLPMGNRSTPSCTI